MELKQFIQPELTLLDVKCPKFNSLRLDLMEELTMGKIFLTHQTLCLLKADIRTKVAGGLDNYEISDQKLIEDRPIKVHKETFKAGTLAKIHLNNNKSVIVGYTDFIADVIKMYSLAKPIEKLDDVNNKFTCEILRLLNSRSDINRFRELQFNSNLYVYFLNHEYMVLTNRGIDESGKVQHQEFFVTIFKLGSLFESYLTKVGFKGNRVKPLEIGRLSTYPSTIQEKYLDRDMVFYTTMGSNKALHWFHNDGYVKRKDRLQIQYLKADPHCYLSMCNREWGAMKSAFGIPVIDKKLIAILKGVGDESNQKALTQ